MLHLALLALPLVGFTKPQPWILGFTSPGQLPFLVDMNGDGMADLVRVSLGKDAFADVAYTIEGQKCGDPVRKIGFPGKDVVAATVGKFSSGPEMNIMALTADGSLVLDTGFPWGKIPAPFKKPVLATIDSSKVLAWSADTGKGVILPGGKEVQLPHGTVWVGTSGTELLAKSAKGTVRILDKDTFKAGPTLPNISPRDTAVYVEGKRVELPKPDLPVAPTTYLVGDIDGNGVPDVVGLREGAEAHTGNQVLVWRGIGAGDDDPDHDGLTNAEEAALGTDPLNPDTDGDGLLDGWEVKGFRGLDLKALGCSPLHADVVALVSRFPAVKQEIIDSELKRAQDFYAKLETKNPDGTNGLAFHAVMLGPVSTDDLNNPWWANRDKYRPAKWRGVVHWMQITPGGGGQADELGDGGTCGEGAMWAVFVHEFGHQMGLNHEGFWPNNLCPTYPSLMNYAYSYSFEDDGNKIHYSNGSLANYVLRETDLDETIPLPYERVKFLEKGPYRFHLKPAGDKTLIDWNWNGVFGEKHVRADINYSYSTNAGLRDTMGKTTCAPSFFTLDKSTYILHGEGPKLEAQKLIRPTVWEKPVIFDESGLIGDPAAASSGRHAFIVYQTKAGVVQRAFDGKVVGEPALLDSKPELVPTTGEYKGKPFLFLWNPADGTVKYLPMDAKSGFVADSSKWQLLDEKSTNPVGMCTDMVSGEAVLGLAQNQDKVKTNRWQIRRYVLVDGKFTPRAWEWIEGEKGGSRGTGRITVLFDRSKDAGPKGRIYFYCLGMTSKDSPWSCVYMAHQVADKTVHEGWMVKRYYDEWTQSRSAPGVAWFGKDFIYAYRWVDGGGGPTDNNLQVGYKGMGIQDEPMADFDDISFVRNFGLRNSLLILGNP